MPSRTVPIDARADGRTLRTRGQRTRERLLAAGAEVFADRGYHAARVDDVVKLAQTSHGTFYLYFSNKEDLFHALAERVAERLAALAGTLPPLTADADGLAAITGWMAEFQALYAASGPIIQAWTEAEIVATDVGKLATTVWAAFTRALIERIRATTVDDIDPAVAALAFVAMIERANYYVRTGQVGVKSEAVVATLARVTHAGIFGPPG
jgi:AcrR family transcriptional regulator